MTKQNIFLLINVTLALVVAGIMVYGEFILPRLPGDEVFAFNEQVGSLNDAGVSENRLIIQRMVDHAGKSSHPGVRRALRNVEKIDRWLVECDSLMKEALAGESNRAHRLDLAIIKVDSATAVAGVEWVNYTDESIERLKSEKLPAVLASMQLQDLRAEFISVFGRSIDELAKEIGGETVIYDNFTVQFKP